MPLSTTSSPVHTHALVYLLACSLIRFTHARMNLANAVCVPQARGILSKPTFGVSDASDRSATLAGMDALVADVRAAYDQPSCAQLLAAGHTPVALLQMGFSARLLSTCGAQVDVSDLMATINSGATLRKLGFHTVDDALAAIGHRDAL